MAMHWNGTRLQEDCSENLNIACSQPSPRTVYKLFEQTGGVDPRGQPSRTDVRSLNGTDEFCTVGLVLENPSMYLQVICQEVYNVIGKQVSSPTICRLLARHGFPRKKIQQVARQRSIVIR